MGKAREDGEKRFFCACVSAVPFLKNVNRCSDLSVCIEQLIPRLKALWRKLVGNLKGSHAQRASP